METRQQRVFLCGASGYVGGRLVAHLLESGYPVRCLARSPAKLRSRRWSDDSRVEIVRGAVGETASLARWMSDCEVAYYLIHSMVASKDRGVRDRELAGQFADAAARAGVRRIVYLGGLAEMGRGLSPAAASRREVARALASSGVPLTVLRTPMVLGSGSASYEMTRNLVERLPVMLVPRWVGSRVQPISVCNLLSYLVGCLDCPATVGRELDLGGADVATYAEIMQTMAQVHGLPRRMMLPLPLWAPRASAAWIHLVTPIDVPTARLLAEGLRHDVVCRDDQARRLIPLELLGVREAIETARGRTLDGSVETSWSDAGIIPEDPDWAGGKTFVHSYATQVSASPESVFRAICRIGGGNGWYAADALWRLRGMLDRVAGGPGLRRGRRDAEAVAYGDALDFWRVTGIRPDRWLELRAEMKVPGEALLEFNVVPLDGSPCRCRLIQTARFRPRGLAGLAYWYAVLPFHGLVFRGMLNGIRRTAEAPRQPAQVTPVPPRPQ